jgi:hypothetical protein
VFLSAYKQGAGEVYSGKCDSTQWSQGSLVYPDVVGRELDGKDNRDEVVLRTQSHLFVFRLGDDGKWQTIARVVMQSVREARLFTPERAPFTGRSLAVGDVDGDGGIEIITTGNYWVYPVDGHGVSKSYLLMFDSSLSLEAWAKFEDLNIFGPNDVPGLPGFCVGYTKALQLADTDGNGTRRSEPLRGGICEVESTGPTPEDQADIARRIGWTARGSRASTSNRSRPRDLEMAACDPTGPPGRCRADPRGAGLSQLTCA